MNPIEELNDSYETKKRRPTVKNKARYEKAIVYYVELFVEAGKNHFTYQRPSDNAWCVDPMSVRTTLDALFVRELAEDICKRAIELYKKQEYHPMLLF